MKSFIYVYGTPVPGTRCNVFHGVGGVFVGMDDYGTVVGLYSTGGRPYGFAVYD